MPLIARACGPEPAPLPTRMVFALKVSVPVVEEGGHGSVTVICDGQIGITVPVEVTGTDGLGVRPVWMGVPSGVKPPLPFPKRTLTVLSSVLATATSSCSSSLKSPVVSDVGVLLDVRRCRRPGSRMSHRLCRAAPRSDWC